MGADQDAWANSSEMGIPAGNTMAYPSADTRKAYEAMSGMTRMRASNVRMGLYSTTNAFADAGIDAIGRPPLDELISDVANEISERAKRAGLARADSQTAEERHNLAQKAARARWEK